MRHGHNISAVTHSAALKCHKQQSSMVTYSPTVQDVGMFLEAYGNSIVHCKRVSRHVSSTRMWKLSVHVTVAHDIASCNHHWLLCLQHLLLTSARTLSPCLCSVLKEIPYMY